MSLWRGRRAGFTLVEVSVGLVIIGILVVVTIPNVRSFAESQRMAMAGEQVASAMRASQARARSENHNIVIEYRIADDAFAIIDDENNSGTEDGGETVTVHPLPDGLSFESTTFPSDVIVFDNHGHAVGGGNVLITGREGVQPKRVRVSSGTGQVRIQSGRDN